MKGSGVSHKIILASKSPRRRYLLEQAGLKFAVIPSNFDEDSVTGSSPAETVRSLAQSKAGDIADKFPESWVIAADTLVVVAGQSLGKPRSRAEAHDMLRRLSGRTHQVLTGYCICCRAKGSLLAETVETDVRFKTLTEMEIDWYIQTGEPFDKAGAYAIQGIGTFLVKSINGSYTNVVGLPVCEVIEHLIGQGVVGWDVAAENGLQIRPT
jgi:septum formation protein